MGLKGFAPQKSKFKAKLVGGKAVTLHLRAFTLADLAWFQAEFPTENDLAKFSLMQPEPVCKALWQMLEPESKKFFAGVKFTDADEKTGAEITIEVDGYKKLLYSFADEETLLLGMGALAESRGLNGFIDDLKKKTMIAA